MPMMRVKMIVGLLLALVMGFCPCLSSLASPPASENHACCPEPAGAAPDHGCCIRAPLSSTVMLAAPDLSLVALLDPVPAATISVERAWLGSTSLSPPGAPPVLARLSRAPPSVPA